MSRHVLGLTADDLLRVLLWPVQSRPCSLPSVLEYAQGRHATKDGGGEVACQPSRRVRQKHAC